jgi:hypothetical protein
MSGSSGLSAMIRAGAVLENEFESIEVIAIGRSATAPVDDYTMEVGGALERHEIKSLRRPIEAGTGEFGWVIA